MEALGRRGIRSEQVEVQLEGSGTLSTHVLTAGNPSKKWILLVHGFPELAFSWRKLLPLLAQAGYFAVAPDMRGYGSTAVMTGLGPGSEPRRVSYDDSIDGYDMTANVGHLVALTRLLQQRYSAQHTKLRCVVGHDMGSSIAACMALLHPELVESLVMMSAPYTGAPLPPDGKPSSAERREAESRSNTLRQLASVGRKHYQLYFTTRAAAEELDVMSEEEVRSFYRGYYYFKSGLHGDNIGSSAPTSLGDIWSLDGITKLPRYYIMDLDDSMSETVMKHVPSTDKMRQDMSPWMSEDELDYYVNQFYRSGFQGGLNHYRIRIDSSPNGDSSRLAKALYQSTTQAGNLNSIRAKLQVPAIFIAGYNDWGTYQSPGSLSIMASTDVFKIEALFNGVKLIDGAGHWVQQEQPDAVAAVLLHFLEETI